MKSCDYCGKKNEDGATICADCGSELVVCRQLPNYAPSRDARSACRIVLRDLNAASGTLIFLAYLLAQVLCVLCLGGMAYVIAQKSESFRSGQTFEVLAKMTPILVVLCPIFGGLAVVLVSLFLVPVRCLKDRSPDGAAWVSGSPTAIIEGLFIGFVIGATIALLILRTGQHVNHRDLDALAHMALRSGWLRTLALVVAVLLGPTTEEIVFRGILFGGFRKTVGTAGAAFLTTFLFLLLHLPKVVHHMPTALGLTAVALGSLWWRLRSRAVGAAVAVHIGYNAVIALVALLLSGR